MRYQHHLLSVRLILYLPQGNATSTDPNVTYPAINVTSTDSNVTYPPANVTSIAVNVTSGDQITDLQTSTGATQNGMSQNILSQGNTLFFWSSTEKGVPVGNMLNIKCLNILILDRCCDIGLLSAYGIYIDFDTC